MMPGLRDQLESLACLIQQVGYTHPDDLRRHLQAFWDLAGIHEGYSPGDEHWERKWRFYRQEAELWLKDFGWARDKQIDGGEMLKIVERALHALSPATPGPYNDV